MRFSETFGITRADDDDSFDPHLAVDTELFLGPLLLFLTDNEVWQGVHVERIAHVVHVVRCYEMVPRGGDRSRRVPASPSVF